MFSNLIETLKIDTKLGIHPVVLNYWRALLKISILLYHSIAEFLSQKVICFYFSIICETTHYGIVLNINQAIIWI